MTKSARLVRALGGVVVALCVSATTAAAQEAVRVGTASVGSSNYVLAVGASKLLSEHGGVNTTAEPVGGSSANMFAMHADKIEFAMVNGLAAYDAYHARPPFQEPVDFGVISESEQSLRHLIVRADAGVETPADLAGKTIVGDRPALPEIGEMTRAILKAYGVPESDVQIISTTTTGEALEALTTGAVDAVVVPASPNAPNLAALASDVDVVFVSFPDDELTAIMAELPPSMSPGVVPAGMYPGQPDEVRTPATPTLFIADARVSEEIAYKMAKSIFENLDEFATIHATAASWTPENALAEPKLPFHPGAVRYFKEAGLWNEEAQARQDSVARR